MDRDTSQFAKGPRPMLVSLPVEQVLLGCTRDSRDAPPPRRAVPAGRWVGWVRGADCLEATRARPEAANREGGMEKASGRVGLDLTCRS